MYAETHWCQEFSTELMKKKKAEIRYNRIPPGEIKTI
jgi:hypothetical protein